MSASTITSICTAPPLKPPSTNASPSPNLTIHSDSFLFLAFNKIGDVNALGRCCVVCRCGAPRHGRTLQPPPTATVVGGENTPPPTTPHITQATPSPSPFAIFQTIFNPTSRHCTTMSLQVSVSAVSPSRHPRPPPQPSWAAVDKFQPSRHFRLFYRLHPHIGRLTWFLLLLKGHEPIICYLQRSCTYIFFKPILLNLIVSSSFIFKKGKKETCIKI